MKKPIDILDPVLLLERVQMLAAGVLVWEHKQTTAYNYLVRVLQQKIKESQNVR